MVKLAVEQRAEDMHGLGEESGAGGVAEIGLGGDLKLILVAGAEAAAVQSVLQPAGEERLGG